MFVFSGDFEYVLKISAQKKPEKQKLFRLLKCYLIAIMTLRLWLANKKIAKVSEVRPVK